MGTDAISAAYHDFGAWGVSDVTSNVVDLEVDLERGTSDAFRVSFASDSLPPHATLGHLQVNACVYHGVDAMEPFRILAAKIGADLRDLTIIGSHSTDNLSEVLSLYPALTTFRYTLNSPQAALGNLPSLIHTFRTRAPQLRDLHLGISLPGCSRGVLDDPYLIDADWSPGPIQHLTLDLKISRDLDTNLFPAIFRIARALAGLLAKDGTITAYQTWERRDACTARMNYLLTAVTLWLQTSVFTPLVPHRTIPGHSAEIELEPSFSEAGQAHLDQGQMCSCHSGQRRHLQAAAAIRRHRHTSYSSRRVWTPRSRSRPTFAEHVTPAISPRLGFAHRGRARLVEDEKGRELD